MKEEKLESVPLKLVVAWPQLSLVGTHQGWYPTLAVPTFSQEVLSPGLYGRVKKICSNYVGSRLQPHNFSVLLILWPPSHSRRLFAKFRPPGLPQNA